MADMIDEAARPQKRLNTPLAETLAILLALLTETRSPNRIFYKYVNILINYLSKKGKLNTRFLGILRQHEFSEILQSDCLVQHSPGRAQINKYGKLCGGSDSRNE